MIKRVLVTGGSGFVGKELIRKILSSTTWEVINIDIVPSFIDGVTDIQHDLSAGSINVPPIDACFHLASKVGGILLNQKNELIDYNNIVNHSTYLICKPYNPVFVFVSTINVFEKSCNVSSIKEPTLAYSISKLRGEEFLKSCEFSHFYIVRPSNIFGRSQIGTFCSYGESHVIPDLVNKINNSKNNEIEVWGNGEQIRNFIHVSDLCNFLIKIIQELPHCMSFNVVSNITMTIKNLVNNVLRFCQRKSLNIKFNDYYMKYETMHIENILKYIEPIGEISSIESGLEF